MEGTRGKRRKLEIIAWGPGDNAVRPEPEGRKWDRIRQ
jgi:hypothetical protein